jgi:AcrR family transcriptional regulator
MARKKKANERESLRDAQKALTRSRILDGAAQTFFTRGYASTTVDDIVRAAGVSRATFYLHFPSIAAVMEALLERVMPELHGLYEELLHLGKKPSEPDVALWVEHFFDFYAAHKELLSASTQAEAADLAYSRGIEALSWRLVTLFAPSDRGHVHVRALILIHELDRIAYLVAVRGWDVDRGAAVRVVARHWWELLQRT